MNNEVTKVLENEEVIETGTEIAKKVAGNGDLLKKFGKAGACAAVGIVVYEGGKKLIKFIKSKSKKEKNENDKSEASNEKAETVEN